MNSNILGANPSLIDRSRCLTTYYFFFFSSRRRHTRFDCDWSSDVCSSDLWAYDQVRDRVRREAYDRARAALRESFTHADVPVGPGPTDGWQHVAPPPPSDEPSDTAGPFTRARRADPGDSKRIDFGRYAGWSIRDLAHQDPT